MCKKKSCLLNVNTTMLISICMLMLNQIFFKTIYKDNIYWATHWALYLPCGCSSYVSYARSCFNFILCCIISWICTCGLKYFTFKFYWFNIFSFTIHWTTNKQPKPGNVCLSFGDRLTWQNYFFSAKIILSCWLLWPSLCSRQSTAGDCYVFYKNFNFV